MNILITICARGGSKGIPKKNIKNFCGKPLISYTIKLAQKLSVKWNAKIALSTDDVEIKDVVAKLGIQSDYIRPSYLATDEVGKVETIKDLVFYEESINNCKYDFVLDLDVSSPLRTFDDIERAFNVFVNNDEALTLFSVNKANRSPYFNMVEENESGFYSLVKSLPDVKICSRQASPKVYDLNASFYWYRRKYFNENFKSPITEKSLVFVMDHICFDIDHPIDFLFMEYLVNQNKLEFQI